MFFWMHNRNLVAGQHPIWAFQPIRWWYLYKVWVIANIVEVDKERKVTWEVTALPGFYARHTYHMEDLAMAACALAHGKLWAHKSGSH
jgi:hypothetical protein